MTAHQPPTCAACLAPTDSTKHDAECVAPLVVLCGESPVVERESGRTERDSGAENGYDMGSKLSDPTGVRHLPGQRPHPAKEL